MAEKPSQQPPEQPDQQQPEQPTAEQAAALAALLVGAGTAAAGAALTAGTLAAILALLSSWGYDRRIVRVVVSVTVKSAGGYAAPGRGIPPAARAVRTREPVYDAWFILNAARRAMERTRKGKSIPEAIRPERSHWQQRQRARQARRDAANRVDELLTEPGLEVNGRRVLVWRAHVDDRVTWECRAADGRWFYADTPPFIGYPGVPHGGTCRCWPAPATPAALRGNSVDDAVRSAQGTGAADHPAEPIPTPVDPAAEAS